jgi:hypothetical protein
MAQVAGQLLLGIRPHTQFRGCWPSQDVCAAAATHRLPDLQAQVVVWLLLRLTRVVPAQQQQEAPWPTTHVLQGQGTTQVYASVSFWVPGDDCRCYMCAQLAVSSPISVMPRANLCLLPWHIYAAACPTAVNIGTVLVL